MKCVQYERIDVGANVGGSGIGWGVSGVGGRTRVNMSDQWGGGREKGTVAVACVVGAGGIKSLKLKGSGGDAWDAFYINI